MILALCLAAFTGAAPVHTSVYTDMENDCSDASDPELAAEEGRDVPLICKGPGGWTLEETYSACDRHRHVDYNGERVTHVRTGRGEECIRLSFPSSKAEWRLRNGRPIALIMRVICHENEGECITPARGEYLVVQPLRKGALPIAIDARRTRKANEEARKQADALP